jgi:hypothetical protein
MERPARRTPGDMAVVERLPERQLATTDPGGSGK